MKFGQSVTTLGVVALAAALPTAVQADGNLFTMTNARSGNQVLMYTRDEDNGRLEFVNAFDTGTLTGQTTYRWCFVPKRYSCLSILSKYRTRTH